MVDFIYQDGIIPLYRGEKKKQGGKIN